MSVQVRFRRAMSADAEGVAEIYLASRKTFLPFVPLVHTDAEVREWIAGTLIPAGHVTVAISDGRAIGMMAVSSSEECDWIDQLYLHPSVVSRGIGSQLLACALQELGLLIRLYTFQANTGSRRFYERHGFRAVAFTDGANNEEHCPDVLYELDRRG